MATGARKYAPGNGFMLVTAIPDPPALITGQDEDPSHKPRTVKVESIGPIPKDSTPPPFVAGDTVLVMPHAPWIPVPNDRKQALYAIDVVVAVVHLLD